MTAFEGNDVKNDVKTSDGEFCWMQQAYGHTYVEQLLHQIVETMGTVRRFIFIF